MLENPDLSLEEITLKYKKLLDNLFILPNSREVCLAKTKLQESFMWIRKSFVDDMDIIIREKEQKERKDKILAIYEEIKTENTKISKEIVDKFNTPEKFYEAVIHGDIQL